MKLADNGIFNHKEAWSGYQHPKHALMTSCAGFPAGKNQQDASLTLKRTCVFHSEKF